MADFLTELRRVVSGYQYTDLELKEIDKDAVLKAQYDWKPGCARKAVRGLTVTQILTPRWHGSTIQKILKRQSNV